MTPHANANRKRNEPPLSLEDVLTSKCRMKILKSLNRLGQLNVSEIAKRVGANYKVAFDHLKVLEDEAIIQHREFGRTRLFRFNEMSPKAKAIQRLLESWEQE